MSPLKWSCSSISDVSFEEKQEVFSAQILTFIKSAFRKGGERKTRIDFLFRTSCSDDNINFVGLASNIKVLFAASNPAC